VMPKVHARQLYCVVAFALTTTVATFIRGGVQLLLGWEIWGMAW